ncbi:hypothetical protein B0H14DRAFT_2572588 [Mycena olivaceomarginata]|nr:hypothetical protein B0H14DRAFT_2572588 [Mycena olivaceomarginata]
MTLSKINLHALPCPKKRAKETKRRKPKTTADKRHAILMDHADTVKLPSGGLKGTPHRVYCKCEPGGEGIKLDRIKLYNLKNWESHLVSCELKTGVKAGSRTTAVSAPTMSNVCQIHVHNPSFSTKTSADGCANQESNSCGCRTSALTPVISREPRDGPREFLLPPVPPGQKLYGRACPYSSRGSIGAK